MNFDLVAPHFRWMECVIFGKAMQMARVAFLSRLSGVKHALLLGEGDGRFLAELLFRHPSANVDSLDSSARMLDLAKSGLNSQEAELGRVKFVHADARSMELPNSHYDLVVTNFFFDCFNKESIERIISKIGEATKRPAHWLLADFQNPNEGKILARDKLLLRVMYLFFRYASRLEARELIPTDPLLKRIGFIREEKECQRSGFIKSELWRR